MADAEEEKKGENKADTQVTFPEVDHLQQRDRFNFILDFIKKRTSDSKII